MKSGKSAFAYQRTERDKKLIADKNIGDNMSGLEILPEILPVGLSTNKTEYEMNGLASVYNKTPNPGKRRDIFAKYEELVEENQWE